ncbi:MAG TPA: hypothetical protein VGN15_08405, partial [Ktedonobacteraceae bacterium]|nr:hypothetical protein [Ktedonobacteraceae bacterium]
MGDLFLTDEEARAVADSHNRAHGISHNADNPSAPHFAQLIEAGAKITLDTDPEILHQALTLVALNHRDPARALPNIIRADLPDDQVAHLIGIACTEAASLRSNAVFALQGDLTSISQSIQPISPDELGRAHAMIGRISDRIVLDQRALADFRSRMPGELYERIAIATRIDPTIAAARALESATTEYLMWQWQRIQASQQAPSIATASLVESQATDRPQARRPFPAQLGERKRLDQEQRHAQELVRTLILRLQRSQHEVRDADVPRRQRQAALRGAALQQLRLNDAEWGDISGSEEMWLIHRTLVNRFGTTEGYDYEAVDSAAQARLGVSVDELIAASIKRTLGLHGDVGAIMTVLNDFTLNGLGYTPATAHPRDTGMRHQARMLAGGARRRMFEMMPRSEAVRLEQARLQPRRLGAQPPAVNLVSLHQRTLQQAQQRRSEVLGGASETPRRVAVAARRVRPSLGSNPGDTGGVNGGRPASRSAAASETRTANEALGQDD